MLASRHRRFHHAAETGDVATLHKMLTEGIDPSLYGGEAVFRAVQNQHHRCVEMLAPLTQWSRTSNIALVVACQNNDLESVRLLLPHFVSMPDSVTPCHAIVLAASASRNSELFNAVFDAMPPTAHEMAALLLPKVTWSQEDLLLLRARLEKQVLASVVPTARTCTPTKRM